MDGYEIKQEVKILSLGKIDISEVALGSMIGQTKNRKKQRKQWKRSSIVSLKL